MSIELSIIIAIVGVVLSVVTFVIGRQTSSKNEGFKSGKIEAHIENIEKGINEIKADMKEYSRDAKDLESRVGALEEKIKTVFIRIDELRAGKEDKHRGE